MEKILLDITGIDKAILLRELVNRVWRDQASLRLLPLREARLEVALRLQDGEGPERKGPLYFAYMDGVRLEADLGGDQIDLTRYRALNFPELRGDDLKRELYERIAQYTLKDAESGLVARAWVRSTAKGGRLSETPLERSRVAASFLDPEDGHVVRVTGTVVRDDDGQLVVRSWSERTGRTETPVPRDASVEVKDGPAR